MTYDPEALRLALRKARAETQMTQPEAAKRAGVPKTTLWRIETGSELKNPKFIDLAKLAVVYGVSLDEWAGQAGIPTRRAFIVPATADVEGGAYLRLIAEEPRLRTVLKTLVSLTGEQREAFLRTLQYMALTVAPPETP